MSPGSRRRLLLGCGGGLLVVAALLVAGYLLRAPILEAVARFLVVREEPVQADMVLVHAGEPVRAEWGARLVREGWAPRLLFFLDPRYERGYFGMSPEASRTLAREALKERGVPPEGIVLVRSVTSTWEEGLEGKRYLRRHPEVRRLIVVSSPFHMRRVRAVWHELLEDWDDPPELVFVPVPWEESGVRLDRWWTREDELVWVQSEYIKLVFYHLRHF